MYMHIVRQRHVRVPCTPHYTWAMECKACENTLSCALLSVRKLQFFVKLYHVAILPVSERFFAMEGQLFVGLELF